MSSNPPSNQTVDTAKLQQLDSVHYLHPFTDTKQLADIGVRIITEGKGIYVWDSEGNKILDGMSGLWLSLIHI